MSNSEVQHSNWVKKFLGKPAAEVKAADVLHFFRQHQREGPHLEFKSGKVRIDKVLKEISAFLNAEGGLLIVGAPREADLPGLEKSRNSFGEPDPSPISSAGVIFQAIQQQLSPVPAGIEITQVRFNSGSVFLIEVQPSANPPHQVSRVGTYYLRDGDSSRPASHQELEVLFFRKRQPDLKLRIALERKPDLVLLHFYLINESTKSAELPRVEIHVSPVIDGQESKMVKRLNYQDIYLPQAVEWYEVVEVRPQNPVFYLRTDFWCRDVPVKSKAAFIKVHKREAEVLQAYDSSVELHFNAHDFFYQYSYLLED